MEKIAIVHSPYREKFAIPRQPGLVAARGQIELLPPYNSSDMVRGLDAFSHIWVLFEFHQTKGQGWKPLVRPPRLGGNTKVGVLATRSTFRPNPIGMSVVKLDDIDVTASNIILQISGMDLLDQTPVYDIKPYISYSDSLKESECGYAGQAPLVTMEVEFSDEAELQLTGFSLRYPDLRELIVGVLSQDPRPAYKSRNSELQRYGVHLYDLNITWDVNDEVSRVISILKME